MIFNCKVFALTGNNVIPRLFWCEMPTYGNIDLWRSKDQRD